MKQPDYMENGDGSYKTRTFVFESHKESLTVKIIEMMDPSYGMYVWPCSPVLAQYLWFNREHIKGKRILEIGAGTGLPGILAALLGARVTLSDSSPLGLKNCQRNVEANGLTANELGPIDIILGSDCFYDPKDFENIIVTVSYLLHQNPHGRFWCTYQIRSADYSMEGLLGSGIWSASKFHSKTLRQTRQPRRLGPPGLAHYRDARNERQHNRGTRCLDKAKT
ncbi:hypothetical protein HPB52_018235 [Rhipicephalus sanguineus]|uniref:Methyltransferase-like protein 23 n=1 Tax=Rhipicephalus sanguineus TaxID=34632 RepID=A0A9D4ST58_RHISA|nr:hypothetical protein HPB52_018235 [Rhipicephalus sanguineus]